MASITNQAQCQAADQAGEHYTPDCPACSRITTYSGIDYDKGWSEFENQAEREANTAFHAAGQTPRVMDACSACGSHVAPLTDKRRGWVCPTCRHTRQAPPIRSLAEIEQELEDAER